MITSFVAIELVLELSDAPSYYLNGSKYIKHWLENEYIFDFSEYPR